MSNEHKAGCQCIDCRTPDQNAIIESGMRDILNRFINNLKVKYEGRAELAFEIMAKLNAHFCIEYDVNVQKLFQYSDTILNYAFEAAIAEQMKEAKPDE